MPRPDSWRGTILFITVKHMITLAKTMIRNGRTLPEAPGIYMMKNRTGEILYIGKAGNLRRRVGSYFSKSHDRRIEQLLAETATLTYKRTDTSIEALILESALIKKHEPRYNVREKDDKSFLYVAITKEKFPRVLLVRGKDILNDRATYRFFGPFTAAGSLREALRIIRKIFPWNTHAIKDLATNHWPLVKSSRLIRPCFEYEIGLCPGTCLNAIAPSEYRKTVRNIVLFLDGKKNRIIKNLERGMKSASQRLEFEKAASIKRQLFSLRHIQDVALIGETPITSGQSLVASGPYRVEGYDISNISGTSAIGVMVVFQNGQPDKNEYRKFRIRTVRGSNDVGMLREVFERRFKHSDWPLPYLILVDGGIGQVRTAKAALTKHRLKIPVVGIAKGPRRKRNDFYGLIPPSISKKTLIMVRDEAHRFAISYHRKLRSRRSLDI